MTAAPSSTLDDAPATLPTERDLIDLLKLSFLLQATDAASSTSIFQAELGLPPPAGGGFAAGSQACQDLCRDLKDALRARTVLGKCAERNHSGPSACGDVQPRIGDAGSIRGRLGGLAIPAAERDSELKKLPASKTCTTGPLLGDLLLNLVQENVIHSLVPYLTSSVPVSNSTQESEESGSGGGKKGKKASPSAAGSAAVEVTSAVGDDASAAAETAAAEEEEEAGGRGSMKSREVTIHVCDDGRDERRDFSCPQDLLLDRMGYFRDITSGQSLDDVDISVHCDLAIFEWLMAWIKHSKDPDDEDEEDARRDEAKGEEESCDKEATTEAATDPPALLPNNVMSILVSASFLKITGLVEEALAYAHNNMGKVLSVMHNFNCLGEPLFSKLAYLFKASEVEDLPDRRDRLQSRLYVKLIYALCEPLPQPEREIFYTAASLYRCRLCGSFLTQATSRLFSCVPARSRVSQRGEVVPRHQRDPSFAVNDFIRSLKQEVKTWRRVFWRLWGLVHPLYCSLCATYFPCYLHSFCPFHPQDAEFQTIQFKNSTEPFGRYPCCDSPALRYRPVVPPSAAVVAQLQQQQQQVAATSTGAPEQQQQPAAHRGCQTRDHRVKIRADQETTIYRILMAHRDAICLSAARKSGIKIACDANSVTLPKPNLAPPSGNTVGGGTGSSSSHQRGVVDVELYQSQRQRLLLLLPNFGKRRRSLVKKSFWEVAKRANPMMQQASGIKKANSSTNLSTSTFGSLAQMSSPSPGLTLNSLAQPVRFKLAARRWRNFTYGRLKRNPKLPVKQQQSSESSSAASTEDLSEDETSNNSSLEDEEEAGLEYELDSKDLCIEIKLAKDGAAGGNYERSSNSKHSSDKGEKSKLHHGLLGLGVKSASSTHLSVDAMSSSSQSKGKSDKQDSQVGAGNVGSSSSSASDSWMRWDNERSTRANQDHQRELECSAFRTTAKLFRYTKHQKQQTAFRGIGGADSSAVASSFNPNLLGSNVALIPNGSSRTGGGLGGSSHNLLSVSPGWTHHQVASPSNLASPHHHHHHLGHHLSSSSSVPSLASLTAPPPPSPGGAGGGAGGGGTGSGGGSGGGSFLKLEQDWKETHTAYLHHRGHAGGGGGGAGAGQPGMARTATPSSLGVPRGSARPGSAASTRSAGRMMRAAR